MFGLHLSRPEILFFAGLFIGLYSIWLFEFCRPSTKVDNVHKTCLALMLICAFILICVAFAINH